MERNVLVKMTQIKVYSCIHVAEERILIFPRPLYVCNVSKFAYAESAWRHMFSGNVC